MLTVLRERELGKRKFQAAAAKAAAKAKAAAAAKKAAAAKASEGASQR